MPPRCVAGKCQSGLRPALGASASDGIWITDAMLARAIERYRRASSVSHRTICSTPGPIESRRRLGKRHMTASLTASQTTTPPWAVEFPMPIGEWKWKPPTMSGDRARRRDRLSLQKLWDRLLSWLEDAGDESMAAEAAQTSTPPLSVVQQYIASFHNRILRTDPHDLPRMAAVTRLFLMDIVRLIERRMVSSDDLALVLDPFNSAVASHIDHEWFVAGQQARVLKAVIQAIRQNKRSESDDPFTEGFWQSCVDVSLAMPFHTQFFQYFEALLSTIPPLRRTLVSEDHIFQVTRLFMDNYSSRYASPGASWISQQITLSRSQRSLVNLDREKMWERLQGYVDTTPASTRALLQFELCLMMSFDPDVSDETLFKKIQSRLPTVGGRVQRFQLLQGRLWAARCISPSAAASFSSLDLQESNWGDLYRTIRTDEPSISEKGMQHICRWMFGLGCPLKSARDLKEIPNHARLFQEMALACADHDQVLRLWANLRHVKALTSEDERFWGLNVWGRHMKRVIQDAQLPQGLVWHIFGTSFLRADSQLMSASELLRAKDLLDQMSGWILESTHLSERQLLRNLTKCVAFSYRLDGTVSTRIISHLSNLVIRDLERGHLGRTPRLRWVVDLIEKNIGPEEGAQVLRLIEGWRWTISQQAAGPEGAAKQRLLLKAKREAQEFDQSSAQLETCSETKNLQRG